MSLADLVAKAMVQVELAESAPEEDSLFPNHGKMHDYIGRAAAAASALEAALKEMPDSLCLNLTLAGIYLNIAQARFRAADYVTARSNFEKARDVAIRVGKPTQDRLAAELSNPALSVFEGYRNLGNFTATLLLMLAQAYDFLSVIKKNSGRHEAVQSDSAAAKRGYRLIMDNFPAHFYSGIAAVKLGDMLFREGTAEEAAAHYGKSLSVVRGTKVEAYVHRQLRMLAGLTPEHLAGPEALLPGPYLYQRLG